MMNWTNAQVIGNTISIISENNQLIAFVMDRVSNPVVKENEIRNAFRLALIQVAWYDSTYSEKLQQYQPVYNEISDQNKSDLLNNTLINVYTEYVLYRNTPNGEFEK